ncbi:hypothetical protein AZ34_08325 [Hylemonella gracilis str. Niagara R]|uniref:Uncharacterized protein n=1 Tax=Hylemonella gracilis str. Niagara R TaxID=1458275 RepID=A0A016XGZ0_9BURK|nr:hypothetical protein [Hylemonella gracilis]EYC51081.1 hypothetical protein AZ34_08325 [Hylemonella gracilis str. Niagara R]
MALTGKAAVAMWWHIAADQKADFLDWHTHEHLPERLRIPGFQRGTRWSSEDDETGFFVMYELSDRQVLAGPAYLARLNDPTPWSVKMMPHHAGMVRSLCDVTASAGAGIGRHMLTLRISPAAEQALQLRAYLKELVATLPTRRGVTGAHLLEKADLGQVAQTQEQRIRGQDRTADWVFLVCGHDAEPLRGLLASELAPSVLNQQGGVGAEVHADDALVAGFYGISATLSAAEV